MMDHEQSSQIHAAGTASIFNIQQDKPEVEANRFTQLRNKPLNPFPHNIVTEYKTARPQYLCVYFGIPTFVVPSAVASHFPQSASYFPSTLRNSSEIPIDMEEAQRFEVLWDRRASLAPFDSARHDAAVANKSQKLQDKLSFARRCRQMANNAKLNRAKKAFQYNDARNAIPDQDTPWMPSSELEAVVEWPAIFSFGHPSKINPSLVASHFRHSYRVCSFTPGPDIFMSLESEEKLRFNALHARRESIREHEQFKRLAADERRMLFLSQRQLAQNHAGMVRATKLATLKIRQDTIEAGFWGIPSQVHPAYVATIFHRTSALFSDHYLYTVDPSYSLPLEEEEKIRFIPLFDRRMDRREREEVRNVAAFFRRDAIIKSRVAKLTAASKKRESRLEHLYERRQMAAMTSDSRPSVVTPSEIATHFPHITKRFGVSYPLFVEQMKNRHEAIPGFDETLTMPLQQEELVRFAPLLMDRRYKASAAHDRCIRAAARRNAILLGIQKEQHAADARRKRKRTMAMIKKNPNSVFPTALDGSKIMEALHFSDGKESTGKHSAASPLIAAIATPMTSISNAIRSIVGKNSKSGQTTPKASTPASNKDTKRSPMKTAPSTPSSWLQSLKQSASAHFSLSGSTNGNSPSPTNSSRQPSNLSRSIRPATGTRLNFSSDPTVHTTFPPQRDLESDSYAVAFTDMQMQSKHYYEEAFIPDYVRMAIIESHFRNAARTMEKSTGVFNIRTQNASLSRKEEETNRFSRLWKRRSIITHKDHQRTMESEGRALALLKAKKDAAKAANDTWMLRSQEMRAAPAIHAAKWARYDQKMQNEAAARRENFLESRVWQQQQDDKRRNARRYDMCDPTKLKRDAKAKNQQINNRLAMARKARSQLLNTMISRLQTHHKEINAKVKKAIKARNAMEKEIAAEIKKASLNAQLEEEKGVKKVVDTMKFYDDAFAKIQSDEFKVRKTLMGMEKKLSVDIFSTCATCGDEILREARAITNPIKQRNENAKQKEEVLFSHSSVSTADIEKSESKARFRTLTCAESVAFKQMMRNEVMEREIIEDEAEIQFEQKKERVSHGSSSLPRVLPADSNQPRPSASSFPTHQDPSDNLSPTAQIHPHSFHKDILRGDSANICHPSMRGVPNKLPSNLDIERNGFPPSACRAPYYSTLNTSTSISDPSESSNNNPVFSSSMSGSFSGKPAPISRQSTAEGTVGESEQKAKTKREGKLNAKKHGGLSRSFKGIFSDKKQEETKNVA